MSEGITGPVARHFEELPSGELECRVCPRLCRLSPGQRGFCFVRGRPRREDDHDPPTIRLTTHGRSSGLCIDPIEKKPLAHFLPGTPVLSLGTAGCNLACKFCQNWESSRARDFDGRQQAAEPEALARAAAEAGCRSIALTYNDPVIFLEYAVDCARAARARGLRAVAVSAGYVLPGAREELFGVMDAANIDLKAFTEDFYWRQTGGHLEPVKETLVALARQEGLWLELTVLVIPTLNDSEAELRALAAWVAAELGPEVPLHLSAFHPDFRLRALPATPARTLRRARGWARAEGLRHVYTGNVHDPEGDATHCAGCGEVLIERDWYELLAWRLTPEGACPTCGAALAGVFEARPGRWGRQRLPLRL
ncbi:MAG: AmmeMemoRadiSam system radical SAM enzyme [Deltaproteobacteria bacterium]|nr:AmmeMemoRadiSam system radical SAM enzyme [Deltaproteobacteria bacterium]